MMNLFHKTATSATSLTLERACHAVFGPALDNAWRPHELERRSALARAAIVLSHLERLGLVCGVFGSALRPGDFFHHSDVDLAAWLPGLPPVGDDLAMAARMECHRAMQGLAFDLVLLPCANEAFGLRILHGWARGLDDVARASRGEPMLDPLSFGPADVAFIDRDRLDIARRAAQRMSAAAANPDADPARLALSLCSSMQTILRIAEKCSKDVLRQFASLRPPRGDARPLYPILAYPCEALGGRLLASQTSVRLYFECRSMAEPPGTGSQSASQPGWALRMALMANLFSASMRSDFDPALDAMDLMAPSAAGAAPPP